MNSTSLGSSAVRIEAMSAFRSTAGPDITRSADPISAALAAGDTAFFQAVPGIGKRTAERIVVELRDKVDAPSIVISRGDGPRGEARDGLLELGFPPAEAESLLQAADGETVEELIQSALRLARR